MINRDEAFKLLCEWVSSDSLRKHMLCVESAMREYAKQFNEDEELWGITGLLHDLDYEKYPEVDADKKTGHPFESVKYFESQNFPRELIEAILGHALYSGVPRKTNMSKALFAVDELCGFLMACAYMRPDKFESLNSKSVIKKLKDKSFAAKVSRDDIYLGVKELGVELERHIDFCINALRKIQNNLF